jgi:hypothetical protein
VSTGLTLAFELAALKQLADPETAMATARGWSEHVGVVTDRPPYVLTKFTRDHGLRNDFPAEPAPAVETLAHMREHHDTERYVLVTGDGDDDTESATEWERLPLSEAAERAEWELASRNEQAAGADDGEEPATDSVDSDWP